MAKQEKQHLVISKGSRQQVVTDCLIQCLKIIFKSMSICPFDFEHPPFFVYYSFSFQLLFWNGSWRERCIKSKYGIHLGFKKQQQQKNRTSVVYLKKSFGLNGNTYSHGQKLTYIHHGHRCHDNFRVLFI